MIGPTELLHPSPAPLQNFPGISDLLPEASKFQHHTKPCSKCSILLVSSSNLSPICCKESLLLVERSFCHANPGFNFTLTSSITQNLLRIIKCTWHFENIPKSVIYTPKQIADIAYVSKFIYRIQQFQYKINFCEVTFELCVLLRTQSDSLLKSLMIFYPSQNAANTNVCYNANCCTTLHYSFAEFTELPGDTIKENRRNFVVNPGRFPAMIFLH